MIKVNIKIYGWQRTNKKTLNILLLSNYELKQWGTIAHLLEWLKYKTLKTENAGKDVEKQEFSFFVDKNAKWHSYFGKIVLQFLS